MTKYVNWPNLKLTYVIVSNKTDYWGLPEVVTVSYFQVCKRSLLSLKTAQRLCQKTAQDAFPDAVSVECINVQWLNKPLESSVESMESARVQLDIPF